MNTPKISLCIISRKEDEKELRKSLSPWLREHVDEIIVVDTSTGEKIWEEGVRNELSHNQITEGQEKKLRVLPFPWTGSFADARNFSFEQATNDIIFWIDSDDIVEHPENLPKLAQYIADGKVDWIYLDYHYFTDEHGTVTARHWKPRLIRKGTGHWVGNVHEDLSPDAQVFQGRDVDLGKDRVVIKHVSDEDHITQSAERNLSIQLAEIERDKEKVDPRTIQYTAMSLQSLGRFTESLSYFMKHIQVTGSKEDKFWSLYRMSFCLTQLGRTDEALDASISALKIKPEWNITYFSVASVYFAKEDWNNTVEWVLSGLEKEDPDTLQVVNDSDTTITPYFYLITAYLHLNKPYAAHEAVELLTKRAPNNPLTKEAASLVKDAVKLEKFVDSFMEVASNIKNYDRVKAAKLFDLVPTELDDDLRIQRARALTVPPTVWGDKSIVIYCGKTLEDWAYPSIFSGIGGSEEAVIMLSEQLVEKGYAVTVYNRCGDMKGTYKGVEYRPYYHFNQKDTFNVLIGWRSPALFNQSINANKKYLWLHDIASPEQLNQTIIDNVDKILFLSKWHRNNLPNLPEEKVYITNNGINPSDFTDLPPKQKHTAIYASSYDRGALCLIRDIAPRILKEVPDFKLHLCYGLQNIVKEMEYIPSLKVLHEEIVPLIEQGERDGWLIHHGRVSHKKLAKLMGESQVWTYPTEFGETYCITADKAQAAGCIPITTESGAIPERILSGHVELTPIYTDSVRQEKFAKKVIEAMTTKQSWIRDESEKAKKMFSWETTATSWVNDLL